MRYFLKNGLMKSSLVLGLLSASMSTGFAVTNVFAEEQGNHVHDSTKVFISQTNDPRMAQVVQPAQANWQSMNDVLRFVSDHNNECKKNESRDLCYKMLQVTVGQPSTSGTTQCPPEFALVMSTDNNLKIVYDGKVINGNMVSYTAKDVVQKQADGKDISLEMKNFYEENGYSCEPDKQRIIKNADSGIGGHIDNTRRLSKRDAEGQSVCRSLDFEKRYPVNHAVSIGGIYVFLDSVQPDDWQCRRGKMRAYTSSCYCSGIIGVARKHCHPTDGGWDNSPSDWTEVNPSWYYSCKYSGYPFTCTRPAGYYFNANAGDASQSIDHRDHRKFPLPQAITNPISGPSVALCARIKTTGNFKKLPG